MSNVTLNNLDETVSLEKPDYMLGKGLQMPFAPSNSGYRKLMFGTQLEHRLPLLHPEVAYIQTGYETRFGENSSSYNLVENEDLKVIGIIPKFKWNPTCHYYVFVIGCQTGEIEVFERKEYKHITESYGYLYDNSRLDNLRVGDIIKQGTAIQTSTSFDEYGNRMDGANMLTMYSACEDTIEDAIVISESASKKLSSPLVKKVSIIINDNDIPLNLYGDNEKYKIFPDIGEESVNSILCGFRREKKEESLYSQSYNRLRELSISDERYTVSGRVVDIDVYCNNPDNLNEYYNAQIKMYYNENLRMAKEVVKVLSPYLDKGYKMDLKCHKLYSDCAGILDGKLYFSERLFSNIIIDIMLVEEIPVLDGDKLSNRYGGKGITSRVRPDALMPKTKDGKSIDVILNMCGVYGRENAGQLFEISVSYICMKLMEYFRTQCLEVSECVDMFLRLLKIVSPSMHDYYENMISTMTDDDLIMFLNSITDEREDSIYLVIEPLSENMTIDKLTQLYNEFPWIKPEDLLMPIIDSSGKVRYAKSRRPMIYGYQYIYRLKQYAEEKFSVTSLSATNIRNENSKSKSSNNYKALYSRTPIRFGDMETGNLIHLGAELVVQMLMLYSTSPHARRLTSEMLTGDAFNVDIQLDMQSKNRNVEILNVYLKTMGLRLVFNKVKKTRESPILESAMFFQEPHNKELDNPIIELGENERIDMEKEINRLITEYKLPVPMDFFPMEFD